MPRVVRAAMRRKFCYGKRVGTEDLLEFCYGKRVRTEDALSDGDDESVVVNSVDDAHDDDCVKTSTRVEENIEASSEGGGNANGRRSGRLHQKKMRIQRE